MCNYQLIIISLRLTEHGPYRDSNSDPSAVQPVASRYTDCPILAPPQMRWVAKEIEIEGRNQIF
jgi:hypothetical protein